MFSNFAPMQNTLQPAWRGRRRRRRRRKFKLRNRDEAASVDFIRLSPQGEEAIKALFHRAVTQTYASTHFLLQLRTPKFHPRARNILQLDHVSDGSRISTNFNRWISNHSVGLRLKLNKEGARSNEWQSSLRPTSSASLVELRYDTTLFTIRKSQWQMTGSCASIPFGCHNFHGGDLGISPMQTTDVSAYHACNSYPAFVIITSGLVPGPYVGVIVIR